MGDILGCRQRINGDIFKRMTLLDSAHQIGIFPTRERKLMVVRERGMRVL